MGILDGLPQLRTGTFKKSIHPVALAARIVILTHGFVGRLRVGGRRLVITFGDLHVLTFVARFDVATPPQLDPQLLSSMPAFTSFRPRAHSHPEDYLRRTLARAAHEITRSPFPAREAPPSRC